MATRAGRRTLFAESAYDRLGVAVDDGEQDTGRTVRNPPPLFPFLHRPDIEPEAIRELLAAQLHSLA